MNFIDTIKSYFQPKQEKSDSAYGTTAWSSVSGSTKALKDKDYLASYAENGWLYTCMNAISEDVATLNYKLLKKKGEDVEQITEHPLLGLLYKVNPFMTKTTLLKLHSIYLMATGKSYWYLVKNGTEIKEIYPLRPDLVKVIENKTSEGGLIKGYEYRTPQGKVIKFEPEEIIPFQDTDPMNMLDGVGSVEPATIPALISKYAEEWNRDFYYNNAAVDMILSIKGNISEDQKERIKKDWLNKYGGRRKNSRFAILQGDAEVKEIGTKQRDLQFMEGLDWARDKIMSIFRVNKTSLGITDDVNRANAEASDWVFTKRNIRPKMEAIIDTLNEYLTPMYEDGIFLDFDDPTPEDRKANADYYAKAINTWMTTNEARAEMGLEAVDGGDDMYMINNQVPLGTKVQPIKFATNKNKPKINLTAFAKSQMSKITKSKVNSTVKAARNELQRAVVKDLLKIEKNNSYKLDTSQGKTKYWFAKNDIDEQYEKEIIKSIKPIYTEQIADVTANITLQKSPYPKKSIKDFLFDKDKYRALYLAAILPVLKNAMRTSGNNVLAYMGYSLPLGMKSPQIVKYIEASGSKFANSVVDTQTKKLKLTLAEGVSKGEGAAKLTKRVNVTFKALEKYQANTIARTEVLRATNKATIEAYRQSNVVSGKEWLTTQDGKVCDWCGPMNGKIIPDSIDKNFFNSSDKYTVQDSKTGQDKTIDFAFDGIGEPPLHPNCRCTTVPVLKSDSINEDAVWDKPAKKSVNVKKEIKKIADKELKEIRELKEQLDEAIRKG